MPSLIGTNVAANYLRVEQSPGAALAGLITDTDPSGRVVGVAPLLTFSTPNLRLFKVSIAGADVASNMGDADSLWSKTIRALQVTSELFAVFAPDYDVTTEGASTFCFMAPDFNSNVGPASPASNPLATPQFTNLESALNDATGGTATVSYVALTGVAVA